MRMVIVLGLALALSAQAPHCPNRTLDGHWWLRANSWDRALYCRRFLTVVGLLVQTPRPLLTVTQHTPTVLR
jgi:hypothetical protein